VLPQAATLSGAARGTGCPPLRLQRERAHPYQPGVRAGQDARLPLSANLW